MGWSMGEQIRGENMVRIINASPYFQKFIWRHTTVEAP